MRPGAVLPLENVRTVQIGAEPYHLEGVRPIVRQNAARDVGIGAEKDKLAHEGELGHPVLLALQRLLPVAIRIANHLHDAADDRNHQLRPGEAFADQAEVQLRARKCPQFSRLWQRTTDPARAGPKRAAESTMVYIWLMNRPRSHLLEDDIRRESKQHELRHWAQTDGI